MTFFVTFTFDLEERHQLPDFLGFWVLLNRYRPKSYKETNSVVIRFSIEYNGGTQVDDLLDVEFQKRFTAISI